MATQYLTLSWEQMHRDMRTLCARLEGQGPEQGRWRGIVAIARGGLIPAAIVAAELEYRLVEAVAIATYEKESRGQPVVLKPPPAAGNGEGFLVIDDLADTGTTLRFLRQMLPAAYFAAPYAKPAGRDVVDCYVREVPQDTWIVFPWDPARRTQPEDGQGLLSA